MRSLGILGVLLLAVGIGPLHAQIPEQLSYQGVLTDTLGNPRPNGSYAMTFRLYTVASGGSPLWTEAKSVSVTNGIFTTYLGDTTPFPGTVTWAVPYWLSTQVGAAAELSPRIKLASAAYSLNADSGGSQWSNLGSDIYYTGGKVFVGRNFPISGNEHFGVRGTAGPGVYSGMYVEGTDAASWPFYGFATNGSFRSWTYLQPESTATSGPGWKLYLAGIRLTVPPTGGLRIGAAQDYSLVIENTTGSDGIRVLDTGDDAIQIGSAPDVANYGVYIPSPGVSTYGLWPNTSNASGQWALYTVDNIEAGNVVASAYTIVAKVSGSEPLTKGDVVAATGVSEPIPGSQPSLSLVRRADETQFTGIVGVVESRMVWAIAPGKAAEGEMSMQGAEGPAYPGDYVSLTITGVAQVKVDANSSIVAGQRLTASSRAGYARALKSTKVDGMTISEGAPVIGVALSASNGRNTIPVHVTLR